MCGASGSATDPVSNEQAGLLPGRPVAAGSVVMNRLSGRCASWRRVGLAAGLALVATAAAVAVLVRADGSAALRSELEAEFTGAYPAQPVGGGQIVDVELVAGESTVELSEGPSTAVWVYNGVVPGPPLRVTLGDTLRVTVRNELPASTTIHWHGIRVPNDMDGVPGVNQPHIEPGETFVYEFTPPDPGTYWYHSHTNGSEQLERGLYGSLVVTDDSEATGYAHDAVWVIDDWRLGDDNQIDPDFNTSADRTQNGRWGNLITVNANADEELVLQPGDRVRLRLINASNGRVYTPDFGDLDATLIAVDGLLAKEQRPADGFALAPGNRVDIDLTAPNDPGTYFVIDDYSGIEQPLASLLVEGGDETTSTVEPPTNEAIPDWDRAQEAAVDHELVFETVNVDDEWLWTVNGLAYPEYEPLELTAGQFTKIRLVNETHPLHPIHLHGQFFKVLSRNGEPVDEPFFRDTVLLDRLDVVEIGLVPLDVGTWVLHCHIQEHAEAGMMTIMNVEPAPDS